MKTEHTPGPWAVDPDDRPGMEWNNHIVQQASPHIAICFMTHSGKRDNSEAEANARLIASAPELLAALDLLVKDVADYEAWQRPCHALDVAIAALKKARGE